MSIDKKIKILTLGDMPLSPSGVGTQSRYFCEALLKTGKFQISSMGGAIKHQGYNPIKTEEFGEDWVIYPVDHYGDQSQVRSIIRNFKPDILWFMTDPRFWAWLWEIENEIRPLMPMVYHHVWDNHPAPTFNRPVYESNDVIVCISKLTHDIVQEVSPGVQSVYLPHAVNSNIFVDGQLSADEKKDFKREFLNSEDKMLFFWNNRNARRKQSGSLIFWFKEFLDKVGHDKAVLLMHTDTKDVNGQDLDAIVQELGLDGGQVYFSRQAVHAEALAKIYNVADCTINISDAEGFGLATLESLACGTPIIVNMTGGLQEQVTDGKEWFGIGIEPSSKSVIGCQSIPFIYEDRINGDEFVDALVRFYNFTQEERDRMGRLGKEHVEKNYNFETFEKRWVDLMLDVHEEYGSWETRKNYHNWKLSEVA